MRRIATSLKRIFALLLVGFALLAVSMPAMATIWTVDTLGEPADGDASSANCIPGACTLRDAINSAQAGDTVQFALALDGQTILLTLFTNDTSTGSTEFGPSAFFITGGITLTVDGLTNLSKGITIARDINIADYGDVISLPNFRLFDVDSGSTLTLQGLTLSNGMAQGGGSDFGGGSLGAGGAVFNQGNVTINRCTLSANTAVGGGIFMDELTFGDDGGGGGVGSDTTGAGGGPNGGALAVDGGNGGFGGGGGQANGGNAGNGGFGGGGGADYTSPDGFFSYNGGGGGSGGFGGGGGGNGTLGGFGGGFGEANAGTSGSGGGMGGAIFNDAGNVSVTNSTITGNQAVGGGNDGFGGTFDSSSGGNGSGFGGGIFNYNGHLTLNFVTVANNIVDIGFGGTGGSEDGGAIYSLGDSQCATGGNVCANTSALLTMDNSIAALSSNGSDLIVTAINGGTSTAQTSSGIADNLIGVQSGFGSGVLSEAYSQLDMTLGVNQGFGFTLFPLPGSPAIDAVACGGVSVDQRGITRPQGTKCDIGAVEVSAATPTVLMVTGSGEPASVTSANCSGSQCPTLRDAVNYAQPGDTIRFAPALDGATINLTLFTNNLGCITLDASDCLFDVGTLSTEFGSSAFFISGGTTLTIDAVSGLTRGITLMRASSTPFRLFDVDPNSTLNLQGLILSNGLAQGGSTGFGGAAMGAGGAVFNQGNLTLNRCTLNANVAQGGNVTGDNDATTGGGVGADASESDTGGGPNGGGPGGIDGGGGGFGGGGGAGGDGDGGPGGFGGGGAIGEDGGNGGFGGGSGGAEGEAGFGAGISDPSEGSGGAGGGMGGAIFNDSGNVSLVNTTLNGNQALGGNESDPEGGTGSGYGGAIFNYNGSLILNFVTIAGNHVASGSGGLAGGADGGAIYSLGDADCGEGDGNVCINSNAGLTMDNSIAATNSGSTNDVVVNTINGGTSTAVTTLGGGDNLIGSQNGFPNGVLTSANPLLTTTLSPNGGFGLTLYPLPGSPAIDAVACGSVNIDERGVSRPQGTKCDIGAVEAATPTPLIVTGAGEPASITSNNCSNNQCPTLRDAVNFALPGDTIQFAPALDGQTITLSLFSNDVGCLTLDAATCADGGTLSTEFGPSAFFISGGMALTIDGLTGLTQGITLSRDTSQPAFRLFDVGSNSALTLQGLTLGSGVAQGGSAAGGGAGLGAGGAVFNQGQLTINRCTLTGNSAVGGSNQELSVGLGLGGAGVAQTDNQINSNGISDGGGPNGGVNGAAEVSSNGGNGGFGGGGGSGGSGENVTDGGGAGNGGNGGFGGGGGYGYGNPSGTGGFGGGGVVAAFGGPAQATNGGYGAGAGAGFGAGGGGGGAGMGGAIFNDAGNVILINATLSGNAAVGGDSSESPSSNGSSLGGAIFNYNGNVSLSFVTLDSNTLTVNVGGGSGANGDGGAIYSLGDSLCATGGNVCANTAATLTMDNSIAADSTIANGAGFSGAVNDVAIFQTNTGSSSAIGGGNLIMATTQGSGVSVSLTAVSTASPRLGSLGNNGGTGLTLQPALGSPVIDAASNCLDASGATVAVDERGFPRPYGPQCDIGAVEVEPFPQAISFTSEPPNPLVGGNYTVVATGGASGNTVTFSIDQASTPGACTINGATVTFTGAGDCIIDANQAGNASYSPAPQAQQTIVVGQASQGIEFTSTAANPVVGGTYNVTATGGASGNPVTFTTAGVCSVSGATVTFTGAGTCTITANQAGNANYQAAAPVQQMVVISQAVCVVNSNLDDPNDATAKVTSVDVASWSGENAGIVTLRDCIVAANLMTGSSGQPTGVDGTPVTTAQTTPALAISFAANLSGATLTLGNELPLIFNNLSIDASALASAITIDGGNSGANAGKGHRIFFVSGLPSIDPASLVDGLPDPDGAQPIMVSFENLILRNALAHGACSGGGGGGLGAGAALYVNQFALVGLTDVTFANNTAQGGDSSADSSTGGSGGGGMGSRTVGGAGGGLGTIAGGDGEDCQTNLSGVDGQDGRGIGTSGGGNVGGAFGGTGLGQLSSAQNLNPSYFGGGPGTTGGVGDAGGIGGGGHYGNPGFGGAGGYGGGGGDGEGQAGSNNQGGAGGFGGGGGYGVGQGGAGGFGGGGGGASGGSIFGGIGGFGGGGGGGGAYGFGLRFVPGGFGGGRGYVTGGGGAGFGGSVFVRDGGSVTLQTTAGTQTMTGGAANPGVANNGVANGDQIDDGYGIALGQGVFLQGSAGVAFDVAAGAITSMADALTGDCANGNTGNVKPPTLCVDGGVSKTGAGTLIMGAINSYNGATTIADGTLQLDGSLISGTASLALPITSPSTVTINAGTLSGIGTAAGSVLLQTGSITPGHADATGTLSTGSLTWSAGSTLTFRLGASNASSDHLIVSSSLLKSGSGLFRITLDLGNSAPLVGHTYTLITSGNASAFSASDLSLDPNSHVSGSFAIVNNQVQFTVSSVISDRIFADGFE